MNPKLTVLRNNLLVGVAVMLPITIVLMFLRWWFGTSPIVRRP